MPPSVVQRLTRYLTQVQNRIKQGKEWISSSELAAELGLTSSTVRQDLSYLDFSGISKKGYEVAKLQKVLMWVLGADKEWKTVVIGAGNLGRAIALHGELTRRGFVIAARLEDPRRALLAFGITTAFAMQSLVHMVVCLDLLPPKGIPLPLVSYGKTEMLVTLVSVGVLLNLSREVKA